MKKKYKGMIKNHNKCFLEVKDSKMSENSKIMPRDIIKTVLYNTLIAEEKAKSDSLLSSILPQLNDYSKSD